MVSRVAMLTTAGDLIPIAQEHDITDFDELQKYLSCLPRPFDFFELVRVKTGGHDYIMVVDEEGKLNGSDINAKATRLTAPWDVIVGDVLIFSDHHDPEMYSMTHDEWMVLVDVVG